jgi:2-polyprenyl-3-methyl-5-hydroxy-6-metoxy-1,4-benzoquinol methylase
MIDDTGERLIPEGNTQTLTYGEHLSRYIAAKELVRTKDVLDVASGTGYGSQMLAESAKSVKGLDYSQDAVNYSSEKYPAKNLEYICGNAEKMPFKDNQFDVVVSLETIEHLPRPDVFIKEVKRVLKDNGIFIVSTPNDDEFMDGNEFHVHEFQFEELNKLIKANFKRFDYYYQGTYFAATLLNKKEFTTGIRDEKRNISMTFGQPINKAIYFLAVASNSKAKLPSLSSNVVIADRWSTKDDLERDSARTQGTENLNSHLKEVRDQLKERDDELAEIKNSRSWHLISFFRRQKDKLFGR